MPGQEQSLTPVCQGGARGTQGQRQAATQTDVLDVRSLVELLEAAQLRVEAPLQTSQIRRIRSSRPGKQEPGELAPQ